MSFELIWQEFTIDVKFVSNWLNTSYDHIELRCSSPLPVTQTGYRSQFLPAGSVKTTDDLQAIILNWLDDAAMTSQWLNYRQDSRQLTLF